MVSSAKDLRRAIKVQLFLLREMLDSSSSQSLGTKIVFILILAFHLVLHHVSHVELLLAEFSKNIAVKFGIGVASDTNHLLLTRDDLNQSIFESSVSSDIYCFN